MIRAAESELPKAPRVVGISDWAWHKRYGTIICDLEGDRILDVPAAFRFSSHFVGHPAF